VLTNLLTNAAQYAGGTVGLRVERRSDGVLLEVLDQGPGIPELDQMRIFQPFYRLERSRNQRTGGSGLGLAIVKQLCEAQGWQISVRGREGGGAAFCLLLPDMA